jgi:2-polyprenyl-6-methoxyphenol hydroxylase-like FAD-dependent oxidoreductase
MRILIVGGGIAGLTLAALLRQRGFHPRVIEKRAAGPAGYVIGLWPLGSRVLKGLGLYEAFGRESAVLKRFQIVDGGGSFEHSFPLDLMTRPYGPLCMIRRATLVERLESLTADLIHRGLTVDRIESRPEEVVAHFSDGTAEAFDLIAGCDGIRSRIRELTFPAAQPVSTGWLGFGWLADPSIAPSDRMTEYWDAGRRFCALVPAQGVLSVFAGMPAAELGPIAPEDRPRRVREYFATMKGSVPEVLAAIDHGPQLFVDDLRTVKMEQWYQGRVVLVGDACSAYFPFGGLGVGASMAMESAAVLADELSRTDAQHVAIALKLYQKRRRPRVAVFERASRTIVERMLTQAADPQQVVNWQREMFLGFLRAVEDPI